MVEKNIKHTLQIMTMLSYPIEIISFLVIVLRDFKKKILIKSFFRIRDDVWYTKIEAEWPRHSPINVSLASKIGL